MKINVSKNKIFYIAFFLLLAKICYSTSELFEIPNIVSKLVTLAIGMLLMLKILLEEYRDKQKNIIAIIGIMTLYTSYITKDYNVLLTFLLIVGLKNIELKNVLKMIFVFNIIMLSVHIIAYCFLLISDSEFIKVYHTSKGVVRHGLALGHPNYASLIILTTYMIFMYLNYEKKQMNLGYVIGIILVFVINLTTRSRTTMISIIIFMILIYISKIKKKNTKKILKELARYIFIVISILTLIFLSANDKYTNIDQKVDQVVSGRIWNMKKGIRKKGITVFGQYINRVGDIIILDNVYAKNLINYGTIYLVILSYLFYKNAEKMKDKDYIVTIMFSIIGITEYLIINTCIAVPLIILGDCMFNRNDGEKSEISKHNCTDI